MLLNIQNRLTIQTDWCRILIIVLLCGLCIPSSAVADDLSECLSEMAQKADDRMTIGELRRQCEKKLQAEKMAGEDQQPAIVSERLRHEKGHVLQPFTLMAHKPNYILVGAYNSIGYDPQLYRDQANDPSIQVDDTESQFQISIKMPLAIDLYDMVDIYAAYTNHSFWQVYNKGVSSPFRETNHEPETWIQFRPNWQFLGLTNTVNGAGMVHQSNGRAGVLSRSWNRVYASFVVERGNFVMGFKPWFRIQEKAEDDDNPDITDYLGHYELRAGYKWKDMVFGVMSRNNLESGFDKGAVELSWCFPLWNYPYLKGYIQYFSGYGESLIDYNHYVNKIGFGFALTDWL